MAYRERNFGINILEVLRDKSPPLSFLSPLLTSERTWKMIIRAG